MTTLASQDVERLLTYLQAYDAAMVELLHRLVATESSSDDLAAIARLLPILTGELRAAGMSVRCLAGPASGGMLYGRTVHSRWREPFQLLVGHCDTVWSTGTLGTMPLRTEGGKLYGPGAFDMKGGLVQLIFALRAVRELNLPMTMGCRVLINSDEEIGSPDSSLLIGKLAQRAARAFVLEPAFGETGKLKTARKAVGKYTMIIKGRASHAGVNPEQGVSAVLELSHQIQKLFALNDAERGITVNVGTIAGGTRPNVIAAEVRASIDVRVRSIADAERLDTAIRAITAVNPATKLTVEGGFDRPPMEATERNQALWRLAHVNGRLLGLELEQTAVGGASDGNTTSEYTATLDGLGSVGDGAHADHEHVELARLVERTALLVLLLTAPADSTDNRDRAVGVRDP